MKITKRQLRRLILKEARILNEAPQHEELEKIAEEIMKAMKRILKKYAYNANVSGPNTGVNVDGRSYTFQLASKNLEGHSYFVRLQTGDFGDHDRDLILNKHDDDYERDPLNDD